MTAAELREEKELQKALHRWKRLQKRQSSNDAHMKLDKLAKRMRRMSEDDKHRAPYLWFCNHEYLWR